MAHLSPSVVFSPSVARQQLATAKDWNYIDGWLAIKFYGKSAPPFERNSDTLKALLALAAMNETADEDSELFLKVEALALLELQVKEVNDSEVETFQAIQDTLTREGQASLDALSSTSVELNRSFIDVEQTAQRIMNLQITSLNLEQDSDRAALLQRHLNLEFDQISAMLEELHGDTFYPSTEISRQTLDHQRKTKILATKLNDLQSHISSLSAATGISKLSTTDIKVEEDKFAFLMATVKTLEAQVKSYHGLPHDTDLARLKLEELRIKLSHLAKDRDGIFEGLVERESPKKRSSKRT